MNVYNMPYNEFAIAGISPPDCRCKMISHHKCTHLSCKDKDRIDSTMIRFIHEVLKEIGNKTIQKVIRMKTFRDRSCFFEPFETDDKMIPMFLLLNEPTPRPFIFQKAELLDEVSNFQKDENRFSISRIADLY